MKKLLNLPPLTLLALLLRCGMLMAQDAEKPELSVNLSYFNRNGSFQYLVAKTTTKENGRLQLVKDAVLLLYLDEALPENLIAKVKTNEKGEAKAIIPPELKDKWSLTPNHRFYVVSEATKRFDEVTTELDIEKGKIVLDTLNADGARSVTAQVLAFENGTWVPAKEVELKIAVRRLGGDLKIGDEDTYTTDSLGFATGEFKLAQLPATDSLNNLLLVAKTEDHERFGNLLFEKSVPWGQAVTAKNKFDSRSLWGTRDKAPLWLLFMAGSIVAGVWSVLVYLILQIRKLKKLGRITPPQPVFLKEEKELKPADL